MDSSRYQLFYDKCREVVRHLPTGWKYNQLDESYGRVSFINRPMQIGLYVRDDRINLYGHYPKDPDGRSYGPTAYGFPYHSITVGLHRPARAIAADITRRFIRDYEKTYLAMQERMATKAERREVDKTILNLILNIDGIKPHGGMSGGLPGFWGDGFKGFVYSPVDVHLEMSGLSADTALKIIYLIKEDQEKQTQEATP